MDYKDYYKIIGVKRDATQDEIKRSYRKLARKYHPDVSKETDAEKKFKEVGEAYEVLKDPEKRTAYDQLGANWKADQGFTPPPDWNAGFEYNGAGFTTNEDSEAYSDFFESLFGRQGQTEFTDRHSSRTQFQNKRDDHHAKVMIDLDDAFNGATRSITLRTPRIDAQGHVVSSERNLNVKIPRGIKPGQQIRLAGQGSPGIGGNKAGDLYLEVNFKPHPIYRVEGHDIYLELPLAPWEAALGAVVKTPTPTGVIDLKIPSNSVSGRKLRAKGRGLPAKNPGDFYAVLRIALPSADTEKAKESYKKMQQEMPFNPRENLGV